MAKLKHRIQFYSNLATLENAGVAPLRAFAQHMPGSFQQAAADIQVLLKQGLTVAEAMSRLPKIFSSLECNLVQVGETTGRRDTVYKALRDWFQLTLRLRTIVITGLLYPLLVYHVAALLLPLISIFIDGVSISHAVTNALMMLAAPWVALLLANLFGASVLALPLVGRFLLRVPLVGNILYRLDGTRFFMAYSLCVRSGLGGMEAVRLAAACCRNPFLRRRFGDIADMMAARGCTFSEGLAERLHARDRNSMILEIMHTGEMAGTGDEAAAHIADVFRQEAETLMTRVAALLPTLLYLCLAVYLGFKIIRFYAKLYAPVRELLQ